MNCREFSNIVGEFVDAKESTSASNSAFIEHASMCPACNRQLENERSLSVGLRLLADDERMIEAPTHLRNDLLAVFDTQSQKVHSNVVSFPSRSNWARWALAAAAMVVLGFVLFTARLLPGLTTIQTAQGVVPAVAFGPGEAGLKDISNKSLPAKPDTQVTVVSNSGGVASRKRGNSRTFVQTKSAGDGTHIASAEVKSQFVPLTYLNDATAMESGIVVRVEIAREQLATLGIPFDTERADEVIKADIVVGDDGVARAIRLVQ